MTRRWVVVPKAARFITMIAFSFWKLSGFKKLGRSKTFVGAEKKSVFKTQLRKLRFFADATTKVPLAKSNCCWHNEWHVEKKKGKTKQLLEKKRNFFLQVQQKLKQWKELPSPFLRQKACFLSVSCFTVKD